ncbi:phage related protein [Bacillus methanolicus PB1]|uniref:Phage related protein n=1 Tax=Bacillus methanolicus PB1 TaxID=997296 RepID=I3DXZ8_BACMT|nr:hypothetical protein [Bacillus methanolicus]EIJ79119.1 phage related protein [Bacillus methanolicus PB1]
MKKLEHDLLTDKYTTIYHDEPEFNAPHVFSVYGNKTLKGNGDTFEHLQDIKFQKGPIKEHGVNGVSNEDLISMVICRLEHFQKSEYRCRENALAITALEEALLWLRKRTLGREKRGVEGTNVK